MADTETNIEVKTDKKPFDKKKWRERKYSSKYKVEKAQEERKKFLQRRYKRELKKEGITVNSSSIDGRNNKKTSRIKEAQLEFNKRKQEIEEARRRREEKLKVIKAKREKKAERHKKLSQKTKKGQPLMRARLELLQEKIQRMVEENKL